MPNRNPAGSRGELKDGGRNTSGGVRGHRRRDPGPAAETEGPAQHVGRTGGGHDRAHASLPYDTIAADAHHPSGSRHRQDIENGDRIARPPPPPGRAAPGLGIAAAPPSPVHRRTVPSRTGRCCPRARRRRTAGPAPGQRAVVDPERSELRDGVRGPARRRTPCPCPARRARAGARAPRAGAASIAAAQPAGPADHCDVGIEAGKLLFMARGCRPDTRRRRRRAQVAHRTPRAPPRRGSCARPGSARLRPESAGL